MKTRLSLFSLALVAGLSSCAPRGPNLASKPPAKRASRSFPAAERLTEIAEKPLPPEEHGELIADTDTWTLVGPLPDTVIAVRRKATGPWDKLLAEVVARERTIRATEPMHC